MLSNNGQQVSVGAATVLMAVAFAMIPLFRSTVLCETQSQLEQAQSTENRLESRQQKAGSDDLTATIDYLDRMDKLLQMSRPRFGRSEYKQQSGAQSLAALESAANAGAYNQATMDQFRPVSVAQQWRPSSSSNLRQQQRQQPLHYRPQHLSLSKPQTATLDSTFSGFAYGPSAWARQQQQFDDAIEQASLLAAF